MVLKLKQGNDPKISALERALTQELSEVETRIAELKAEAAALRRQIAKAAAHREGLGFASRKNSINRVLAENSVIQMLRDAHKPLKTAALYDAAKAVNPSLKENTFRTYLHRMKLRNAIQTARRPGEWKIPET